MMKQNLDFATEEGKGRMKERVSMFNDKRAKKSWSKSDINFFAKTLATSLSVDQAKQYVRTFTKDTKHTHTKKLAIQQLIKLPIRMEVAEEEFYLHLDESLIKKQEEKEEKDEESDEEGEVLPAEEPVPIPGAGTSVISTEADSKHISGSSASAPLEKLQNKQTIDRIERERKKFEEIQKLEQQQKELQIKLQELKEETEDPTEDTTQDPQILKFIKSLAQTINKHSKEEEKDELEGAVKILKSKKMEVFPEFGLLPVEIQKKVVLLRFFDIRYLMDIEENFGMNPIAIDLKRQMTKKAREALSAKKFGWKGFCEAFTNLISWSTVFAPEKTLMISTHFKLCQQYNADGYLIEGIINFSNEIRLKNQGLDAQWDKESAETAAYRRFLGNPNAKRRRSLYEDKKDTQTSNFRGTWKSPRGGFKKRCWSFARGVHCSFGAACKFSHGADLHGFGRGEAMRGRGRGRGNFPYNTNNYPNNSLPNNNVNKIPKKK